MCETRPLMLSSGSAEHQSLLSTPNKEIIFIHFTCPSNSFMLFFSSCRTRLFSSLHEGVKCQTATFNHHNIHNFDV